MLERTKPAIIATLMARQTLLSVPVCHGACKPIEWPRLNWRCKRISEFSSKWSKRVGYQKHLHSQRIRNYCEGEERPQSAAVMCQASY